MGVLRSNRNLGIVVLLMGLTLVLVALILLLHLFPSSQSPPPIVYMTHSSPTSQWLVLSFLHRPSVVSANNTGSIPEYPSSESLNETKIGVFCTQTVTNVTSPGSNSLGTCAQFTTFQQTGWYWDQESKLLFIHYLGGSSVELSIVT